MREAAERYRRFLETLTPANLAQLPKFVSDDVQFRDPFNDVCGTEAMTEVFRHMFEYVADIRFNVRHMAVEDNICLMVWHFEGKLSGKPWNFNGTSVVTFAEDGRVVSHVDHWDAARALYERVPLIGWLLRAIRRRIASR